MVGKAMMSLNHPKGVDRAKANMIVVPMKKTSIPHEMLESQMLVSFTPCSPSTGVPVVLYVLRDACGIMIYKSRFKNSINTVSYFDGLSIFLMRRA